MMKYYNIYAIISKNKRSNKKENKPQDKMVSLHSLDVAVSGLNE